MIYRTYLDKCCTIKSNSPLNTGLNPCCELHHLNNDAEAVYSRVLIYFDESNIKDIVENKISGNRNKIRHILHLVNCSSVDFTEVHNRKTSEASTQECERATSFDLLLSVLPEDKPLFDNGKGYDMVMTKYQMKNGKFFGNMRERFRSVEGCNWFQPQSGYKWDEEGVYSTETLSKEYDKFGTEKGSKIIRYREHFDIGNENIKIDITDLVNDYLDGKLTNKGLMISFTPLTEISKTVYDEYISFFSHKTDSYFEPYVETIYDDYIEDDRGSFTLNKVNKLYLYCNVGGHAINLDEIPTCTINGTEYEVKQFAQGIYYAEVLGDKEIFTVNTMCYDTWSNIKYNGVQFDDVEMDFVVYPSEGFFNFGNTLDESTHFSSEIYGIKDMENVNRGDIRKVTLISRENYSKNKANIVDEVYYRLYIKDGLRELDIIPWEHVNRTVKENFFLIDTTMLIPQRYYIDVKYKYNMEEISENEVITFNIVNDLGNKYN